MVLGAPEGTNLAIAAPNLRLVSVEEVVTAYWSDAPIMRKVAWCESKFRQLNKEGKPLRGEINSADIGVMQINEYYHRKTATEMGYDIDTLEGNLAYARYLYEKEGTRPWASSSKCWRGGDQIAQK